MKILWIKSDFLHPTTRGGQIRTLEIVRRLHSRHEVHYLAYDDSSRPEGLTRAPEYCSFAYPVSYVAPPKRSARFAVQVAASVFSPLPLAVSRWVTPAMQRQIAQVRASNKFNTTVCDFVAPAPNLDSLAGCVLFQHNVETVIWRRLAEHARDPLHRAYLSVQARRMFRVEKRACLQAAHVIAVSEADASTMRNMFGVRGVSFVPTGVDVNHFCRREQPPLGADLVFVGSMDWLPNVEGIQYFVRDVLPLIHRECPECTLAVVGRTPPPQILALSRSDCRIQVTGTVPDVRPYLWSSRVSIVPLRSGSGTRLKIYESMAAGVPVVSTTLGAEGLGVSHPLNIRLADTPAAFAAECLSLLRDGPARVAVADAALNLVTTHYSWDRVAQDFEDILTRVLQCVA